MDEAQRHQEDQYNFPYHHIPQWGKRFTQARSMRWGYEYASYMEFLIDLLRDDVGTKNILDIGCGDGRLVHEVQKKLPHTDIAGVDYSAQAIAFARAFTPEATFYVGDITNEDFLKEKYDTLTVIETLEHIPPETIDQFVIGLHNLVEDSGQLVLTVPSINIPVSPKHYQHFSLETLQDTLLPHFTIEKHFFLNRVSILERMIKRILNNRFFILNHYRILNALFQLYKRHLLVASSQDGGRICVVCRKQ